MISKLSSLTSLWPPFENGFPFIFIVRLSNHHSRAKNVLMHQLNPATFFFILLLRLRYADASPMTNFASALSIFQSNTGPIKFLMITSNNIYVIKPMVDYLNTFAKHAVGIYKVKKIYTAKNKPNVHLCKRKLRAHSRFDQNSRKFWLKGE